uniref:C-x(9)-C motif containing 4 homolog (S. cerevisiae) n=1 Tax=Cyprinus carpio TaxID=7962 RepID=A0A8C2ICG1_CYPCA
MPQKEPCQNQACAIQRCSQGNKYIASLCEDVIQAMRKCCAGENSVCSGFTKQHKSTDTKTVL